LDLIIEIFNYSEDEDIVEASVMTLKSFSFDLQSRIKMVGNSNLILRLLTFKRHPNQQISLSVRAIVDLLSLNEKNKEEEVDFDIVFPKLRSKQPAVVEKAAKQIQSACNASVSRVVSEGAIEPLDFALNQHVDLETLEEVLKTLSIMSSNGNLYSKLNSSAIAIKDLSKLNTMKRIIEILNLDQVLPLNLLQYAFIVLERILQIKENRVSFLSNNYLKLTLKYLKNETNSETKASICKIISRLDEEFSGNKILRTEKAIDSIINLINERKDEKVVHTAIFCLLILSQRGLSFNFVKYFRGKSGIY
jgi:hypothetical protein